MPNELPLPPAPPVPGFAEQVAAYRTAVDTLTIGQIATALGVYAVNLARSGAPPAEFELAHLLALAGRTGIAVDAAHERRQWLDRTRPTAVAAPPAPARPGGLWARLRGMAPWRWS